MKIHALIKFSILFSVFTIFCMISEAKPTIKKDSFGITPAGKVDIFTLTNSAKSEVKITNYGGRIVSIKTADKNGKFDDVALGYDTIDQYLNDSFFFGGIIGRYANRIAKGKFSLNDKEYSLASNDGENHLHGGNKGFDTKIWQAKSSASKSGAKLTLTYLSKDGDENYPGNLSVTVIYTLTENNEIRIDYSAKTDQDTIINLTNHAYFNLAGSGSILNHHLQINSDYFTPTDSASIPTGNLNEVKNTPFDFSHPTAIGARIDQENEQLKFGQGYDHNWVLRKNADKLALAAKVFDPASGRVLEVLTTEPGIQFYSGNFLNSVRGLNDKIYQKREGFCLEPQHFPDSPNKANFPPTVLRKGQQYKQITIYKFSLKK